MVVLSRSEAWESRNGMGRSTRADSESRTSVRDGASVITDSAGGERGRAHGSGRSEPVCSCVEPSKLSCCEQSSVTGARN